MAPLTRKLGADAALGAAVLAWLAISAGPAGSVYADDADAGSVRLWPSATIVGDVIHLSDLGELRGFDLETEQALAKVVVSKSPRPGGTRLIHLEMIRSALVASGANMARVMLRGATECSVSRPSDSPLPGEAGKEEPPPTRRNAPPGSKAADRATDARQQRGTSQSSSTEEPTLRQAVIDYFNAELARYGGSAEVIFDRTSEQVLNLSGPTYEFAIRGVKGSPLGLTSLEVEVLSNGQTLQSVPLVVQVAMTHGAVAARRSINQGATLQAADVNLVSRSTTRLDRLGLDDVALAIGQRAKRFIPAGTLLEPNMLEEVPLVQRGELVSLAAAVGGVRVVTTAKAAETGLLGDTVRVRAADKQRVEFDAVVVGPGQVEVAPGSASVRRNGHLAMKEMPR